ncbi:hypothetical protein [Dyadobacter sp. NIV53]|uniref:hypothetical protein n=1 Tax=Dyadobacter sp. NIV53 TaxID=2861765 RepID=UPI001C876C43|nr:hypothetical protein [Dyadobacter sp. NIV53]
MSFITSYCHLNNENCSVNGEIIAERDRESEDSWFKQLYKSQEFVYPKFYKMDTLSQSGYLLSEMIKRAQPSLITSYNDDEIAMLFANQFSSADSDLRFEKSYKEQGTPSPALFVYTLPNIVLGEIAILNKWYGENMFAVLPKFAPDFFVNYIDILMSAGTKAVLCGWLGITGEQVNVFVFLVEKEGLAGNEFNTGNLAQIAGPGLL